MGWDMRRERLVSQLTRTYDDLRPSGEVCGEERASLCIWIGSHEDFFFEKRGDLILKVVLYKLFNAGVLPARTVPVGTVLTWSGTT